MSAIKRRNRRMFCYFQGVSSRVPMITQAKEIFPWLKSFICISKTKDYYNLITTKQLHISLDYNVSTALLSSLPQVPDVFHNFQNILNQIFIDGGKVCSHSCCSVRWFPLRTKVVVSIKSFFITFLYLICWYIILYYLILGINMVGVTHVFFM